MLLAPISACRARLLPCRYSRVVLGVDDGPDVAVFKLRGIVPIVLAGHVERTVGQGVHVPPNDIPVGDHFLLVQFRNEHHPFVNLAYPEDDSSIGTCAIVGLVLVVNREHSTDDVSSFQKVVPAEHLATSRFPVKISHRISLNTSLVRDNFVFVKIKFPRP